MVCSPNTVEGKMWRAWFCGWWFLVMSSGCITTPELSTTEVWRLESTGRYQNIDEDCSAVSCQAELSLPLSANILWNGVELSPEACDNQECVWRQEFKPSWQLLLILRRAQNHIVAEVWHLDLVYGDENWSEEFRQIQ